MASTFNIIADNDSTTTEPEKVWPTTPDDCLETGRLLFNGHCYQPLRSGGASKFITFGLSNHPVCPSLAEGSVTLVAWSCCILVALANVLINLILSKFFFQTSAISLSHLLSTGTLLEVYFVCSDDPCNFTSERFVMNDTGNDWLQSIIH